MTVEQHVNLSTEVLVEKSLEAKESKRCANGALVVSTGSRTGRSPNDRFIVQDAMTQDAVDWSAPTNVPVSPARFQALWNKVEAYLAKRETYVAHLRVGADDTHYVPVKVVNELAWRNLFVKNLFVRPSNPALEADSWTLLSAPRLHADPQEDGTNSEAAIMINLSEKKVLVCGTLYAGEMKKAMFSVLNFILPAQGVLPMHCAANVGKEKDVTLFFGLSGTGKTTLSADTERYLIGDDEHGWNDEGIFNFEGGCYAKCINLSEKNEPVIWNALKDGAIMENVVTNEAGEPDYTDDALTQNTRAAYPREHIPLRVEENRAGQPNAVIFLCCDLYGVLPPVAKLNKEQAAYYFLSGYTALVGSTEVGQAPGVKPTFSTCFGAPFFPRAASTYAELLIERLNFSGAAVYLVNTGWSGGTYGQGGKRFPIPVTRAVIHGIQKGHLDEQQWIAMPGFGFQIPTELSGVDANLLNPENLWADKQAFQANRDVLIEAFQENFKRFDVSESILSAGPGQQR